MDSPTTVSKNVISVLADLVNHSYFYSPFIVWLLVSYVYYSIGIRTGNKSWRYLNQICSFDVVAKLFYAIVKVSNDTNFEYKEVFMYSKYIERVFFSFSEWGLVYLNFIIIRSYIKSLKSKIWTILINLLFIFILCSQLYSSYYDLEYEKNGNLDRTYKRKAENIYNSSYIPIGIIETYLIILIIYKSIRKDKDKSKDGLTGFIKGSLSRMLIVSTILLFNSIKVFIKSDVELGYPVLIKKTVDRFKSGIGILYLMDLLLVHMNSDSNIIRKYEVKLLKYRMKEESEEKEDSEIYGFDPNDPYGLNKTSMDFIKPSSPISKFYNIPTSDNSSNDNTFRNSPSMDYNNNNGNIFKASSPTSDYNYNGSNFNTISEHNRNPSSSSSFMLKQTNQTINYTTTSYNKKEMDSLTSYNYKILTHGHNIRSNSLRNNKN
ncbi:hypothetical protein BCR32DRAFT_294051 [Anaeromyces robustus]|uniref:Uncharacterized protein n=1 Tax=Anaeromyces robustus TaxID=1754192 RepID=A0A1Y1X343_9FUNG|nr:hypothetical protein BCR32DRAFT_294051 [Anaeromyces robustus]|eukprot:ORX80085.1 hypothetical protein BCR32DRAFT_294051 [Anaeromyces robustus]